MSFTDDTEFAAFIGRAYMLPAVTPEAVASALAGFELPLSPDRDMEWLAMAVGRSLGISLPNISDGPERTSNTDISGELKRLAALAGSTWQKLFQRSNAADARLWDHAWHTWDGEDGDEISDDVIIGNPSEYRRFKSAIAELDWLASFLREAVNTAEKQQGPWRQSVAKRLRVQRGQYLAPIYEAAFGQPVSANNFPTDTRIKAQTPFMDFYSRMVTLAFGARETVNLTEVVKAACQLHRQHPAEFAPGIIPYL